MFVFGREVSTIKRDRVVNRDKIESRKRFSSIF